MAKLSPWKLRNSDRSGFKFFQIELVKDKGFLVSGDEYDQPPPSKISLGGEGEISQGEMRSNSNFASITDTDIPAGYENPTVYITAVGGITPNVQPYMLVTGSNVAVNISANPQIAAGQQSQILTLWCVDSGITLENGNGLAMMGSSTFNMTSGSVISFIFTSGGNCWQETSRSRTY